MAGTLAESRGSAATPPSGADGGAAPWRPRCGRRPLHPVHVELAGLLMVAGRNQEAIQIGREGLAIVELEPLGDIWADALNTSARPW